MRLWSWLLALSTLVPRVAPWVLVSKEGDITLLGPLDLDPSYNQAPRVTLRSSGVRLWDIIVQDLYGGNALVFQTPSGSKVAFTPDDETFFNTTLSVLREVKLGGSLSVFDTVNMGGRVSIFSATSLGGTLSVYNQVNLGSVLSVFGHTNFASTASIRDHVQLGSSINIQGDAVFLGAVFSVQNHGNFGSSLSVASFARLGFTTPVFGVA
ncbi:unnamed protein product [Durusdinium trenchii]|uniref:Uncharacterized protein n=1 Tax=Durusdinium trenchii TaxID=1381693 RepID=A0ABP0MFS0_9DINO